MEFSWKDRFWPTIKAHSLTGRITCPPFWPFRNVKRNRGAAGIDRVSIAMYRGQPRAELAGSQRRLKNGTYQSLPLRRVEIPKGQGKTRPLGIPAVRDRVAQEVVRHLLSPLFERIFHDDSYGFRPNADCHMAVQRVLELHRQGYKYVLDADIKGFFDNIPHHVIMNGVAAQVADGGILDLIERFLKAGVMVDGEFRPTRLALRKGASFPPCWPTSLSTASIGNSTRRLSLRALRRRFVVLCASPRPRSRRHTNWCSTIWSPLGLTLSAEKTQGDDVPRRLCLPGIRHLGPLRDDATQVGGEIQEQDPGTHAPASQPGPAGHSRKSTR